MKRTLWICLLFVFFGCTENKKKDKTLVSSEHKIEKINFFMEVSGSMAGYLKGSTDFVKTIPNLLVAIEQKVDSGRLKLHNYYIADAVLPFNGTTEDFIYTIATRHPAREKSSEMHKIFQMIADRTDSNDISMFVSDCILSYSDADIKANREINREKAEGGLKPFVTSTFSKLQKKNDMCASVYGFNSDFDGTYYTYQNGRLPIKKGSVIRPYYLWVIGNRELLKKFNLQLQKLEPFKHNNVAMDFGVFDKAVIDYNIFFRFKKNGEWQPESNKLTNIKISKSNPAIIAIGANLSALPSYAQDTNYLKKNLKLDKNNLDFRIISILTPENINKADLKKNELDALTKSSHVFIIEVSDVYKANTEMKISLPLQYDTSYRNISIMDDRSLKDISGKTFAFEHLVDGVRAAYQNPNQDFISISIPIKK